MLQAGRHGALRVVFPDESAGQQQMAHPVARAIR
jgi:hypothetical protein